MDKEFTIQGNEINGYCVVQKVDGEWLPVTKRYATYDEACDVLAVPSGEVVLTTTTGCAEFIAVVGNGSWGGEGKVHAAVRRSGERMRNAPASYQSEIRYTSRCGQRYCRALKDDPSFTTIMPFDQCQRCAKLVAKDAE